MIQIVNKQPNNIENITTQNQSIKNINIKENNVLKAGQMIITKDEPTKIIDNKSGKILIKEKSYNFDRYA